MEIYTEDCEAELGVSSLSTGGKHIDNAIIEATIGKVRHLFCSLNFTNLSSDMEVLCLQVHIHAPNNIYCLFVD